MAALHLRRPVGVEPGFTPDVPPLAPPPGQQ